MIREVSGTQFDPRVVEALAAVVDRTNARLAREEAGYARQSAAGEIARAQQEMHALHELAWEVSTDLHLDAMLETLAERIRAIVNCAACVFYLLEENEEYLRASAAFGVNQAAFQDSAARVGTYLTGRVASRGEAARASYMADDILLSPTEEAWTPLRATLIVPLRANGYIIGTINLYHTEPNAFQSDDLRIMLYVGQLAGRAIQNARIFSRTKETALTDPLTGLRNSRYLRHFLEQEMDRATRNRQCLAVLGLDLDGFKKVNDRYGHARGDAVLREIGQLFQMRMRKDDLVARYGGDEFAMVLPRTSREEARIVAAKMEQTVDRYAASLIQRDSNFPRIGVSVGVAIFPEDASSLETLLDCADRAMYREKHARRAA
jgi:diguanylate cyclase (GGDEF)-like protein